MKGIMLGESLTRKAVVSLREFAIMKKDSQDKLFFDWTLYASASCRALAGRPREARRKVFVFPGSSGLMICKNAIANMLGYGRAALKRIVECVKKGESPRKHALTNRPSNNTLRYDYNGLMKPFFDALSEFSAPRATRIVATVVNGTAMEELRDEGVSELPPSFTK
jgi:hypothetical protein